MSSNDETNRDPNLDDDARSDAPEEGEESSASEPVTESAAASESADSTESETSADDSDDGVSTSSTSSASRPMSAGARLAAQKAAKAVLKAQKKDERKAASAPADQEALEGEVVDSTEAAPEATLEQTELGRATLRAGDWWAANSQLALGALVAVGVGLAGFLGYRAFTENAAVGAGALLQEAVEAANAPVEAEPADGPEANDDTLSFPTATARDEAALAAYQRVISEHGDTEAAAFARLGAARALVSLGRADEARPLFQAAADRGGANGTIGLQALEGIGFLQEAADDLAGAQATYEQLGLLADRRFEPVSKYHLARLQIARGEDDAARTALRELVSELRSSGEDAPEPEFPYVLAQAEMRLRELDPSTAAATPSFGGGGAGAGADLDPQIQEMLRRLQAEQAAGGAGGGE